MEGSTKPVFQLMRRQREGCMWFACLVTRRMCRFEQLWFM